MSRARTSEDRPPNAEERYLSSTNGSNLRVEANRATDVDAIMAAAFAVAGNPRKMLALNVFRVLASGDMRGARSVADAMAGELVHKCFKSRLPGIKRAHAFDIAMRLLKLWHKRTCPECSGRGHPLIEGTPTQDETLNCQMCHGAGLIPLERLFGRKEVEHARWLEAELNRASSLIWSDMASFLRNTI